jgi:Icc-related predicted phosphoesterase
MDTLRKARMKRVAVITDIHANLPALEAALEAIEWTDVDAVYCGGDLARPRARPAVRGLDTRAHRPALQGVHA